MRECHVGLDVFGVLHPPHVPVSFASIVVSHTHKDRQTHAGLIKEALHPD